VREEAEVGVDSTPTVATTSVAKGSFKAAKVATVVMATAALAAEAAPTMTKPAQAAVIPAAEAAARTEMLEAVAPLTSA